MDLGQYLKKIGEPATDTQILNFEEKYKMFLPVKVKEILYFSNRCVTINRFIKNGESTPEYLTGFFSVEQIDYAIQNMKEIEEGYHYYFSDVLLPIGDPGGARFLCIGIDKGYKDKIYIIHYQDYDYKNLESMLTYIAPSIENLFQILVPEYIE